MPFAVAYAAASAYFVAVVPVAVRRIGDFEPPSVVIANVAAAVDEAFAAVASNATMHVRSVRLDSQAAFPSLGQPE